MEVEYPPIARRYMATLIDVLYVLFLLVLVSYLFRGEGEMIRSLRIIVVVAMFFLYEPICTSRFCTLGQLLMGVRVRSHSDLKRISIPAAFLRILVKILLGWISFVTIPFTKDKRGIHDFVAGSVVVYGRD